MNVGSLFSGIGGFELGFERCGMRVAWQVEQDPYCRAVLARHFPEAQRFEDVREVGLQDLAPVDLICGGFPCQDLSKAGNGAGIDGARSGLWSEFARIVRELRPGYVVVENVPALLTGKGKRWDRAPVGRVLGDLAASGYDAEWDCLPASSFGAPHRRDRVWLVAYPVCSGTGMAAHQGGGQTGRSPGPSEPAVLRQENGADRPEGPAAGGGHVPGSPRRRDTQAASSSRLQGQKAADWWATEPDVGRVADGVPARVDRLRALGNALLPQVAEWIGRRILEHEAAIVRPRFTRPEREAM